MIVICGDSFATPDPDYGPCWVDYLNQHVPVTNFAAPGASNLMISLQVRAALAQCGFVIVTFTSSTRGQIVIRPNDLAHKRLQGYSYPAMDTIKSLPQYDIIKQYHRQCSDLETEIYLNQCIIESTLVALNSTNSRWCWSQGGFEHPAFGATKTYFQSYNSRRSKYNLWDYAATRSYRPFYHVTDDSLHREVANYYLTLYEQTR